MEFKIRMEGKTTFIEQGQFKVKVERGRKLTATDTGSILQGDVYNPLPGSQDDYYIFEAVNSDNSPVYSGITSRQLYDFMDFFFNELLSVDDFNISVPPFSALNNEIGELPENLGFNETNGF